MTELWQIELLGGLQARQRDRCITRFRTHKNGALLAFLAYHAHRSHPRELLVELLWPEIDPRVGRHRLCQALYSLRLQLEPPGVAPGAVIVAGRHTVRLNPLACVTDVARFETALKGARRLADPAAREQRLAEAVALYQGELLPGYFEEWIVPERRRLEEAYRRAARELSRLRESSAVEPAAGRKQEQEPSATGRDDATPLPAARMVSDAAGESARPGYLPLQLTRFFGREPEILRLQALLQEEAVRLVTLSGPGGTGKTRLALQVAQRLEAEVPGGVWFVPLLDLTDPGQIADQILGSLRVARSPEIDPTEQLVACLSRRPVLLLLDNFEHLVGGGAEIVRTLLEQVPGLTLLITSRRCLDLEGEHVFPVGPLPAPTVADPIRLLACESVRLFLDRAQSVRPDFQVTAGNATAVTALCRRLEGLPLAIELAAARASLLTPQQMLIRLEARFELLVTGRRMPDPRHRSLRATLDWSYGLLTPELQRFFARLSVFRGGWTLAAAEAVACPEPGGGSSGTGALECLTQLREASLVLAEECGGEMRYDLLDMLREYAAEQLIAAERSALAQRHARFFAVLAQAGEPELLSVWQPRRAGGSGAVDVLERLETEHDNLRAALAWYLRAGEVEAGLQLGVALTGFWFHRGHQAEGRAWLTELLTLPGAEGSALRAAALDSAGHTAWQQGDLAAARGCHEESLAISRALGDRLGIARALHCLAAVTEHRGDLETAYRLFQECSSIQREIGDRSASLYGLGWVALKQGRYEVADAHFAEGLAVERERGGPFEVAYGLRALGEVARARGDPEAARVYFEESLPLMRAFGNTWGIAGLLGSIGALALDQSDDEAARCSLQESLRLLRDLGARRQYVLLTDTLAEVARCQGSHERAARLLGAALRLPEAVGTSLPLSLRPDRERTRDLVRAALREEAFAAAWEAGQAMSPEQAIAYALEDPEGGDRPSG